MPVGAIATKGVLGEARAAGYRERRGMADGGARVPEVLSAAELEGFCAGFVTEPLEPALDFHVFTPRIWVTVRTSFFSQVDLMV